LVRAQCGIRYSLVADGFGQPVVKRIIIMALNGLQQANLFERRPDIFDKVYVTGDFTDLSERLVAYGPGGLA
jgi:hypothetical protein